MKNGPDQSADLGVHCFQICLSEYVEGHYVPPPKGKGTYCFWCRYRWRWRDTRQRDGFLCAQCLMNWSADYNQMCVDITLGYDEELIRFW